MMFEMSSEADAQTDPVFGNADLLALLMQRVADTPDRTYCTFEGISLSYRELDRLSDRLAFEFDRDTAANPQRIAIMARNSIASLCAIFAALKLGAIWFPVNVGLRGHGLGYILQAARADHLIVDPDMADLCREQFSANDLSPRMWGTDVLGAIGDTLLPEGRQTSRAQLRSVFAVMHTSGTTGAPKGVQVTHSMMIAAAEAVVRVADIRAGDRMFVWEPLFHIGGAQMLVLPLIRNVELCMVSRLSVNEFWRQVLAARCTHIHYLGGILQMLMKQPASDLDRSHGVRVAWGGGCPATIWEEFEARFGVSVRECYGMTETSSIATCNSDGVVGSIGSVLPWFDIEIRRPDGSSADIEERGEMFIAERVPGVLFPGYLNDAKATAAVLTNGVLRTGDIGWRDESGHFYFVGRATDSVRVRGENVAAWDVEEIARMHGDVEDCAMIGVPAEIGENEIKLLLKAKPGHSLDLRGFSSWLAGQLASYQMPRYLQLVDEFERTGSQRIMKHKLSRETAGCFEYLTRRRSAD
jgi:carnitine-CoA ligase